MPRGCARRPRPQSGCVSPENPANRLRRSSSTVWRASPSTPARRHPARPRLLFGSQAPLGRKGNASTGSAAPGKVTTRAPVSETCSADSHRQAMRPRAAAASPRAARNGLTARTRRARSNSWSAYVGANRRESVDVPESAPRPMAWSLLSCGCFPLRPNGQSGCSSSGEC